MILLEISTMPIAWAAPKITKRGAIDPRAKIKQFIRWQIKALYRGPIIPDPCVIRITAIFPVPNSTSKKKERLLLNLEPPTSCDATNIQKLFEDCLKKIVIEDDRKVADIRCVKLYGEKEKVIIKVFTLKEYRELYADEFRRD
jgi:Holliday junction resolvase RusA-like endonuclease